MTGDVQRTALIEGVVRAGTIDTINSVPSQTPVFSLCKFRLRWMVCVVSSVAREEEGMVVAELEPEPDDGPIGCRAWLHVASGPEGEGVGRVGVGGFPFAERIECSECLVWDRRGCNK
eukprot:COSAG02_NODE_16759_length_1057_cov_5.293319_1_plen_117_part_01